MVDEKARVKNATVISVLMQKTIDILIGISMTKETTKYRSDLDISEIEIGELIALYGNITSTVFNNVLTKCLEEQIIFGEVNKEENKVSLTSRMNEIITKECSDMNDNLVLNIERIFN